MAGYPMGQQSYPGNQPQQQQFAYGQGQGFQQQQQQPPPQQFQQQGQFQPQQYRQAQPSQHYGSYGQQIEQNVYSMNAWQAVGFQRPDELEYLYNSKKSQRYNAIQAEELSAIMNESQQLKNHFRIHWSLELCKIMIAMLDRSKDGMMQWPEFQELLQCLTYWYQTFCQYDQDRSGYIEAQELGQCISQKFGYRLSAKAMEYILKRYSRAMDDGRLLIAFDDFVSLSVRLRAYTEAFRARDKQAHGGHVEAGRYEFGYDDFIQCVMCL